MRCLRHCWPPVVPRRAVPSHQRNPTRGTCEAASLDGLTKPGARVGRVTACTEAGASRQASTDGAGLAAKAAAVHPGERRRRLTGETTEGPAERLEATCTDGDAVTVDRCGGLRSRWE